MHPQISLSVAQSHAQDLQRHADADRIAAQVPSRRRLPRLHLSMPRLRADVKVAPAGTTTANA